MGVLEVLSDIPEVLQIIFWPEYTKDEWDALNFWRLAFAFTLGTAFGMAWLAFFFWAMGVKQTLGL